MVLCWLEPDFLPLTYISPVTLLAKSGGCRKFPWGDLQAYGFLFLSGGISMMGREWGWLPPKAKLNFHYGKRT